MLGRIIEGLKRLGGRLLAPFKSRKVRVAVTTAVVAYLADQGLDISEAHIYGLITLGVGVIVGIAHEDNGLTLQEREQRKGADDGRTTAQSGREPSGAAGEEHP